MKDIGIKILLDETLFYDMLGASWYWLFLLRDNLNFVRRKLAMAKTYKTNDVLRAVGICANTLYDWFNRGKIPEVKKDRNKRRIFTEADIERIRAFKDKTILPVHTK